MLLREATAEDFEVLAKQSGSRGCLGLQPLTLEYYYTLRHDTGVSDGPGFRVLGALLAIGGFRLLNPWSALCWMDWTKWGRQESPKVIYRAARDLLTEFADKHQLRCLIAFVEPDFPEAIRTVEHLGFKRTADVPGFFGDKEGLLYVRNG